MARVNKQLLGVINGKIGNLVFRNIDGKTFVSVRPEKYNVKGTAESAKVKTGFKNLISFSAFVNSVPLLNNVWCDISVKRERAYNKIFSYNKQFIKSPTINKDYKILPDHPQAKLFINDVILAGNEMLLDFYNELDRENLTNLNFTTVIIYYSQKKKQFLSQSGTMNITETTKRITSSVPLSNNVLAFLKTSQIDIIYAGIIVTDNDERIKTWSNSKGAEL